MKINAKTKISAIIKANPAAIDAIASIGSHFEKLRNPLLRKILASRVTIADAARIGGADIAVFFEKLEKLGFEAEHSSDTETAVPMNTAAVNLPDYTVTLDVREALENGLDPFNDIMEAVENLEPGQALQLVNTFEPTPLIHILQKRGYTHQSVQRSESVFFTYFFKNAKKTVSSQQTPAGAEVATSFAELLTKYDGRFTEADVRDLEMPLPLTTILEMLPKLQPEEALYVHHRRVPQYLLPQLQERGYGYAVQEPAPGEVKLIIYKI